jgi:putative transposase
MARGFIFITAYIVLYSRKIMGWGIRNSISKQWCMDVLKADIAENGVPEIINSDQGSQYTSPS